jgi:hypothetical protein
MINTLNPSHMLDIVTSIYMHIQQSLARRKKLARNEKRRVLNHVYVTMFLLLHCVGWLYRHSRTVSISSSICGLQVENVSMRDLRLER